MNIETLQAYCLSKKAVEETLPFGPDVLVYRWQERFSCCARLIRNNFSLM